MLSNWEVKTKTMEPTCTIPLTTKIDLFTFKRIKKEETDC